METIKHCTDLSEENDNQWQSLHHSMIPRIVLSVLLQEESTEGNSHKLSIDFVYALKSNAGNVEQMKMKLCGQVSVAVGKFNLGVCEYLIRVFESNFLSELTLMVSQRLSVC